MLNNIFLNPGCDDFNYMTSVCPNRKCKDWTFMFGHLPELVEIIKRTECDVVTQPYPSEQILLDWCEVFDIRRLKERELTSHEEQEVEFFAWLLGGDPKYIWQEFE